MKYTIQEEKKVFDDHYKVIEAKVTYDTFDEEEITTRRLAFERGDSAAIILVEKDTQSILLTNQFRYPTCKNKDGWLLEIPAGSVERNESPEECIIREILEEVGYKISNPKQIHCFYISPGAATERIFLFHKEISQSDKIEKGGGNVNEKEDIEIVKLPISEIKKKLSEFKDAKTILALQWYLLRQEV